MKKLIISVFLIIGMSALAQDRKGTEEKPNKFEMEKLSSEQRNQLMLKKMTLELDLNAKQQEQVKPIIAEQSAKREAMKTERMAKKQGNVKPTADEIFAMRSKMLDDQIAVQNKMKTILSPEQFKDWKDLKEQFKESIREKRGERKEKKV